MRHDAVLDIRGSCCERPAIGMARALRPMKPGEVLLVEADHAFTWEDVPAFCRMTGNVLVRREAGGGVWRYWIAKEAIRA